jgi:hypothetical protein
VSRRASLPGASELFRLTSTPAVPLPSDPAPPRKRAEKDQFGRSDSARPGSGRQKHDAKITVYVSGDELLAMEHARLNLRARHELVVDRGRLVREAVAVVLADFDRHGEDSILVRRLRVAGTDGEEAGG